MVDVLDGFIGDGRSTEGLIEALTRLAPDDPFWSDVEPFVQRVRDVAAEKLKARELMKREHEVLRALGHVRDVGAEALAFHEASDALEWSAANFDPAAWSAVTEVCAELHERLIEHSALQLVQPSNRTAARERRAQFDALEEQIAERLTTLRGLLDRPKPSEIVAPAVVDRQEIPDDFADAAAQHREWHAPLDPDGDQYSVFTIDEEQRLAAPRPGVCLVFGSVATGLDSVDASMARLARRGAALIEVPRAVQPARMASWLEEHASIRTHARMIAWQRLGRWSVELGSGLLNLLDADAGGFRLVLVGGPPEARAFLSMGEQRDHMVARLDAIVACGRWQLPAIEQRIRDARLDTAGAGAADVMAATRGWPRLLDVLWTRKPGSTLDSMIAAFDRTFRSPGGYSGFRAALGLAAFPEAEIIFTLMARSQYSPQPAAAVSRWIADRGVNIAGDIVVRAIEFLSMLQLLEADSHGNLSLDPVAREVMKTEL